MLKVLGLGGCMYSLSALVSVVMQFSHYNKSCSGTDGKFEGLFLYHLTSVHKYGAMVAEW